MAADGREVRTDLPKGKHWPSAFLAAAVFTSLLIPGKSAAYLTQKTALTNSFQFARYPEIGITLTEPSWDPEKAERIVPGFVIPKDPQLTNSSPDDLDELAAIRIEFVYGEACPDESKKGKTLSSQDMELVNSIMEVDYEADTGVDSLWKRYEGESALLPVQRFYYSDVLRRNLPDAGDTTVPLFQKLVADVEAGNELYAKLRGFGGFAIRVEGAALEAETGTHITPEKASLEGLFAFPSEQTVNN